MIPPELPGLTGVSQALPASLRPWLPAIGLGLGGWVATDALLRLSHLPLSPGLTLAALVLGAWWLRRPRPIGPTATDVPGWLERLEQLQLQFAQLEGEPVQASQTDPQHAVAQPGVARQLRATQLTALRVELDRPGLMVALVGTQPPGVELQPALVEALRGAENRVLEAVIVGAPRPCSGARCLLIGLGLFPIITVVSLFFVSLISFISLGFVASLSRYPLAFLLAEPSP